MPAGDPLQEDSARYLRSITLRNSERTGTEQERMMKLAIVTCRVLRSMERVSLLSSQKKATK